MNNATKTVSQILRDNICTVFNALNLMIAIALAAVGAWKNILFIFIILINTVVGIIQEIKAKRQIERLTLLASPSATVLRGGQEYTVRPEEIKNGDVLLLTAGSVLCTDCILEEGRLEVNESILTGESETAVKMPGDKLLSGSNVIAGRNRCNIRKLFYRIFNTGRKYAAADSVYTSQKDVVFKHRGDGNSDFVYLP